MASRESESRGSKRREVALAGGLFGLCSRVSRRWERQAETRRHWQRQLVVLGLVLLTSVSSAWATSLSDRAVGDFKAQRSRPSHAIVHDFAVIHDRLPSLTFYPTRVIERMRRLGIAIAMQDGNSSLSAGARIDPTWMPGAASASENRTPAAMMAGVTLVLEQMADPRGIDPVACALGRVNLETLSGCPDLVQVTTADAKAMRLRRRR